MQPLADIGHVHVLPKVHVSLPTQDHDLPCSASLLHQRTLSSPRRGTKILSHNLDQDLGRGSVPLVQAAQNVVPVAVTAGDKIEGLRQWASGRCLSADRAGVYSRTEGMSGGRVRRVVREPGVN